MAVSVGMVRFEMHVNDRLFRHVRYIRLNILYIFIRKRIKDCPSHQDHQQNLALGLITYHITEASHDVRVENSQQKFVVTPNTPDFIQ